MARPSFGCRHPRHFPWRRVAHVPGVAAVELGDPVLAADLAKGENAAGHVPLSLAGRGHPAYSKETYCH